MRFAIHTFLTIIALGLATQVCLTSVSAQELRQPLSVLPIANSDPPETPATPPAAKHYPQWLMDEGPALPELDSGYDAFQKSLRSAKPLINVETEDYEVLERIRARDVRVGNTGTTPESPLLDPSAGETDTTRSLPFLRSIRERITNRRSAQQ